MQLGYRNCWRGDGLAALVSGRNMQARDTRRADQRDACVRQASSATPSGARRSDTP
jgi:hypothetical protein